MIRKMLFTMLCALVCAAGLQAQTTNKMSKEELAVWQEFVNNAGMGSQLEGMRDMFLKVFRKSMPNMSDACAKELAATMQEATKEFVTKYALPAYKKHFTLEEIKQINAFYRTPVGTKLREQTPAITNEMLDNMKEWQDDLLARTRQVMEKYQKQSQTH